MGDRYIANNLPAQVLGSAPKELLQYTLQLVRNHAPPLPSYNETQLGGLFTGYTGLAYLFVQLSESHPELRLENHDLRFWAQEYLSGNRGDLTLEKGNCGIASEKLSFEAVRVCLTKSENDLIRFVSNMPLLLGPYPTPHDDPFPSEIVNGRAGALYLCRMVKHWVPTSAALLESPMRHLERKIMTTNDDGRGNWEYHGKRYFGAAHGDIGIMTQLILSNPSLAPQLSARLEKLLELQLRDGNWAPSARSLKEGKGSSLVQWCHGAPDFIYSLRSMRPYFPQLQTEIDKAVSKGQDLVWKHGLLTKEPSLCHGIFGNALVLPRGPQREHFLALATADAVQKVKRHDPKLFEPAAYEKKSAVLMNYLPSAAWTWAVCEEDAPRLIMYNDLRNSVQDDMESMHMRHFQIPTCSLFAVLTDANVTVDRSWESQFEAPDIRARGVYHNEVIAPPVFRPTSEPRNAVFIAILKPFLERFGAGCGATERVAMGEFSKGQVGRAMSRSRFEIGAQFLACGMEIRISGGGVLQAVSGPGQGFRMRKRRTWFSPGNVRDTGAESATGLAWYPLYF
ncbi:hypothetical protein G7046_g2714 [Stylonectria norvegica]|nr:hypothetical protein G7046_g2714 [Stylonectria norvegica]